MYSDDSESLTDLSDDEKPQVARRSKKSNSGMGWRVKNALKPPRTTSYTAKALYGMPRTKFIVSCIYRN